MGFCIICSLKEEPPEELIREWILLQDQEAKWPAYNAQKKALLLVIGDVLISWLLLKKKKNIEMITGLHVNEPVLLPIQPNHLNKKIYFLYRKVAFILFGHNGLNVQKAYGKSYYETTVKTKQYNLVKETMAFK